MGNYSDTITFIAKLIAYLGPIYTVVEFYLAVRAKNYKPASVIKLLLLTALIAGSYFYLDRDVRLYISLMLVVTAIVAVIAYGAVKLFKLRP